MKKQLFQTSRSALAWAFACYLMLAFSVRGGATVTTLTYGDVIITGWNNVPTAGYQQIQFLLLKDIGSGTTIKFTLSHFNSTSTANSSGNGRVAGGISAWTADADYAAGTLIMLSKSGSTTASSSVGSLTSVSSGCSCGGNGQYMVQSTSGGFIFIYQGGTSESSSTDYSNNTTTSTFNGTPIYLHGFQGTQTASTWLSSGTAGNFTSYLPSDLASYSIFHSSNAIGGYYNGTRSGTVASLRTAIMTPGNWTTTSGTSTVAIPTTAFTITATPSATTSAATSVTGTGATLNGSVNDNGATTTVNFVYGTSSTLASGNTTVTATPSSISAGSGATSVSKAITGLAGGTTYYYRVTATNSQGTTNGSILNFTTSAASSPSVTVTGQTNVACNGGATGSATVTATGGTTPYTYSWAPSGGTAATASGLSAGTYTCTVTDAVSGTATVSVTITQPSAISLTASSQTNIACNGGATGAAAVNAATGGAGGYTYNWTPGTPTGDGTTSVTGLTAGSWSCTVTDANGCTALRTFTITQPTAISLTASSQTNIACNGGATGAASVNAATGGAGGYTYNWTPGNPTGDGTVSVTGLTAGSWSCTVTDANGCTALRTFTITQPTALSASISSITNVSCNGGSNGTATTTASGGAGGYMYAWTPSGGSAATATGRTAGSYTCTVTDANGCTNTAVATITQPTAIAVTPNSQTNVSCNGGSNGVATINTPTGGAGGYTYNWTPGNPTGDGTTSVSGLTAGTWTCTVTDANTCTAVQTFTITQPSAITLTAASQTNIACNGGATGAASVNAATGGAGGYTYNWTPGNPTGDGTVSVTGLTAGSWSCTVTDANGCTALRTFTITQPTAISASISSVTNVSCNGGSNGAATTTASGGAGGYTYAWTPSGGTAATATGRTAGSYTCTVTDANGCTNTAVATITQPTALSASISAQTNVSCNGGSNGTATATASGGAGGYTYAWTPSGGTAATATGRTAGSYTCTVTDANACTTTTVATITQPSAISVTPSSQTNISCNGGSNGAASINTPTGGAGGYTYNWTPGNPTGDGTTSVTGLTAGTWTCTVTDANTCTAAQTFTITQPSAITLTAASQTNIACNGGATGAASVNAATGGVGGYTYDWTPGTPTGDGTVSVTGLTAGSWTCTVTDANGCTASRTFTITQPSVLSASVTSQTNVSCNGGSNGVAIVNGSGGTPGYNFAWSNGAVTSAATGLVAGSYTCTVTDANGCSNTAVATITQPTVLTASISSVTNVSCNGGSNGSATVTPGGGAGGYTYAWAPSGGTAATATGRTAGSYTCTVTDANSCTATAVATITQPTVLSASISSITNVACNGGSTGAATVTASGGVGGYTFAWAPSGGTAATTTGRSAGSYTCTVTDANSCTTTAVATITQPPVLTASVSSVTNVTCFGASTGAASVTAGGGAGGYTYSWAPSGGSAATATGRTAGSYTCTVTDANGCTATAVATITQPASGLTIASISGAGSYCVGNTINLSVTGTGGTGGLTYGWSGPSFSTSTQNPTLSSVTTAQTGVYTATVTDGNGCTATGTQSIVVNTNPGASTGENYTCAGGSITLTNATGGGTWSSSNTSVATVGSLTGVVTGVVTGTVDITYTLGTGCFSVKTLDVHPPMPAITGTTNVCIGTTTDLDHPTAGGTWSSTSTYFGSVDPTSGVVTGIHPGGYTTVLYSVNPGCNVSASVYTSNIVLSIAGGLTTCVGSTTMLSVPGYPGATWVTPDSATAYINATSGLMLGIAAGTVPVTVNYGYCFTTGVATVNPVPATITGPGSVCVGGTLTLACSTGGGAWTSSNPSVATIDGSGNVSGLTTGTATMSYTIGTGCAATKVITIGGMPAAIGGTTTLCEGATTVLSNTSTGGTWSSSATGTADVTGTSVTGYGTYATVSGIAAGVATISYSYPGGCVQTVNVLVMAPPSAISGTLILGAGGTSTLTSTPGGGTWSSSTPSVAAINATTGVVTASAAGTTTITYNTSATCYTTAVVTVSAPPTITGPAGVCLGATATMTFGIGGGTWSSSNPSVASIDATTGEVTGITAGLVNITYTISAGYFSVRSLYVYNNPPAISGASTLCTGAVTSMTSTLGGAAIWSSSNTAVATIGSATGLVAGLTAGNTDITYTATATGCYSVKSMTVNETPGAISGSSTICVGSDETYVSSPTGGVWSSSAPSIGSITTTTGIATGRAAGGTLIKYTMSSGCFASKYVTVTALPGGISGTPVVCVGNSVTLTAASSGSTWSTSASGTASITATTSTAATIAGVSTGTATISYTNAAGCARVAVVTVNGAVSSIEGEDVVCVTGTVTLTNATSGGAWSTVAPYRVSIGATTGLVTGSSVGVTTISYKVNPGCYATKLMTVNAALPNIVGATFACSGAESAVTFTNAVSGGTWSSSNTSVAVVDGSTGVVTGVLMGGANTYVYITYTTGVGCVKSKPILIKPQPILTGAEEVSVGSSTTMTGSPAGGSWASSSAATAYITGYGIVYGMAAGTATITYTYAGCTNTKGITVTGSAAARPAGMTEEAVTLFSVFPNPSHGSLSVSTGVAGTFTIYTVDGKVAATSELTEGVNAISMPVNMAAGTYLCRFNGVDGSVQSVRLVYEP